MSLSDTMDARSETAATSAWVRYSAALPVAVGVLALMFGWHIAVGAKSLPLGTVLDALVNYDNAEFDHMIVRELRMPRALIAALVGASLSVAGALMQGVTRNPLAEPGILGLMAGASFAVVMAIGVFDVVHPAWLPWVAALGALVTALAVWLIAQWAPGGATPLTLTLAGAAITAFLGALISVAHLLNQDSFEQLRVWLAGSLAGRRVDELRVVTPWIIASLFLALALSSKVTVLAMGDDVARGLGVRTGWLKVQVLVCVVVLTACSVALAGPLGFVGLVIPHVVRLFVGADYRWIVPYSAVIGAAYLLGVDIIARLALRPEEVATGIVTAMVGAPLFIHLVRQRAR
ncbi:FecCD family ABC transporter permease [Saccharospirillum salsuginis]|uniref:Siderophore ABC transporter permease n=1 Tax=Saccharospirillum salsuginis TaxID=418750 RepID=A0A918K9L9_9GAMM|nr:iron ABC transporter permease [Saccharospirillum salsuginis]GGX54969.1 siderophore ABC transporter permease [Saccharospirillum salsuginis]